MVEQKQYPINYQTVRKFEGLVVGVDYGKQVLVENNAGEADFFYVVIL